MIKRGGDLTGDAQTRAEGLANQAAGTAQDRSRAGYATRSRHNRMSALGSHLA